MSHFYSVLLGLFISFIAFLLYQGIIPFATFLIFAIGFVLGIVFMYVFLAIYFGH